MIRKVQVNNYKSILNLDLELGRVTVLIGANGSGKSNILEAVALASAASQNKLDDVVLTSKGVRVTETRFMRAAFDRLLAANSKPAITKNGKLQAEGPGRSGKTFIEVRGDNDVAFGCELAADESASFPKWKTTFQIGMREFRSLLESSNPGPDTKLTSEVLESAFRSKSGTLPGFVIYAPENSALRVFQSEGQILPLGIRGEGLFAHLKALSATSHADCLLRIQEKLNLIDWFESFEIPTDLVPGERSIRIRDRYLPEGVLFDQRSANEGFLFLLFYLTLFISPETPAFFSIDNIDTSLNPKLCTELVRQLASLTTEHDKQVILTTHNPAILDGLDLDGQDHRLLVIDRDKAGHTRARRVSPPKPSAGELPVSLSEAFMRGYIGGLPKNF